MPIQSSVGSFMSPKKRIIALLAMGVTAVGCAEHQAVFSGEAPFFYRGPSLLTVVDDREVSKAEVWIQWMAQPDPSGANGSLRVRVSYTGPYRLYTDATTTAGQPLEAYNLVREATRCTGEPMILNCQFEEYLHVSIDQPLLKLGAENGLAIVLNSAAGIQSRVELPASFILDAANWTAL